MKRSRSSFVHKYDTSYLHFEFISSNDTGVPKPECVVCGIKISNDSMKPSNLLRHLHSKHKEISCKPKKIFERKPGELKCAQKMTYGLSHINTKALRAFYKAALRIAKLKNHAALVKR